MISVKICGITNPDDAQACVKAGARALGFVFYGLSPRSISPAGARECHQGLPASVKRVGVFVNMRRDTVADVAERAGCDMVQLSGEETVSDCQFLTARGFRVVKAVQPRTKQDIARLEDYKDVVFAYNIDAFKEGQYGGTGNIADWALARAAKAFGKPIILAGGITPANVTAALKAVDPGALDICSGVEKDVGRKDPKKLRALFDALKRWDDEVRAKGGTPPGGTGLGIDSGRIPAVVTRGSAVPSNGPRAAAPPPPKSGPVTIPAGKPAFILEPKKPSEAIDAPAAKAAANEPTEPDEMPLMDRANISGSISKTPMPPSGKASPEVEEMPLMDWASISGVLKAKLDNPPGAPKTQPPPPPPPPRLPPRGGRPPRRSP